ncbi:MAG TPA: sodium:proton antiporter [Gemmatimonadales bacterium]|nr:sodium:proton antiporter [Gemmatimonadales bacterium]
MPILSAVPFLALLLAIALMPLAAPRWWQRNRNKALLVALVAAPILVYLGMHAPQLLVEKGQDYFRFMVVIGALFVITGGIHIRGSLAGTPVVNTGVLAIGAVLANVLGTTGASVLLIRPLLRANKRRKRVAHIVVFFIFIVANCAGLLTPIGDPPLLLGFLRGVPFAWTLRLWPQWLVVNGILLAIFYFWDQRAFAREEKEAVLVHEPLRIEGWVEMLVLLGVIVTILAAPPGRSAIIVALALIGYFAGSQDRRTQNVFTFGPLVEVAVLFAGLFATMAPVLDMLNAWAQRPDFVVRTPAQFFWASGALSSVLDNAPTYLAFAAAAAGLQGLAAHGNYIGMIDGSILAAISTGSVFMGANTYIGNAPNFMVRAIAEENGVEMPSFFGYMVYSIGILLPLFIAVAVLFFAA